MCGRQNNCEGLGAFQEKKNIAIPLGETQIKRAVKSLDIIIKTCTSVNLVTQNKKRIFEREKSEYTFRTINSLLNSLEFNKNELKQIKIKIFVIDYNSKKEDLDKIYEKFRSKNYEFEIIKLKLDDFKGIKTLNKDNPDIEKIMKSTMASIYSSLEIA